jgi:hypothetical protein
MKKNSRQTVILNDHLGCFGDFNIEDPVCKKFCALSLRCTIEREQIEQMELLEDLVSSENMFIKIQ